MRIEQQGLPGFQTDSSLSAKRPTLLKQWEKDDSLRAELKNIHTIASKALDEVKKMAII